ncbi:MAG TPA: TRAP transporter small permease subunit, partial [Candidatus Binatia bacterium]|nr:TRAP transporter small permease subunit [Candidatus Binatia bacterium]
VKAGLHSLVARVEPTAGGAAGRLTAALDAVSTGAGWLAGWLIVPMTLAVAYEVVARYAFNAPTVWAYDLTYMLYGAQFMLAAAYTLRRGGHIRTDVFYERWSPRTRAAVDALGYLLFFFPGLLFVLYAGGVEAWHAWQITERSDATPWRPVLYPLKAVIPLSALLLLLQGVSEVVKCWQVIRRDAR